MNARIYAGELDSYTRRQGLVANSLLWFQFLAASPWTQAVSQKHLIRQVVLAQAQQISMSVRAGCTLITQSLNARQRTSGANCMEPLKHKCDQAWHSEDSRAILRILVFQTNGKSILPFQWHHIYYRPMQLQNDAKHHKRFWQAVLTVLCLSMLLILDPYMHLF